jgi:Zn-dependent protease with chaperone function
MTSKTLEVSGHSDEELSLLLAHELSHFMLEHQVERLIAVIGQALVRTYVSAGNTTRLDPVVADFIAKTRLQQVSCFYPQQRLVTKFTERHCDQFAVVLF